MTTGNLTTVQNAIHILRMHEYLDALAELHKSPRSMLSVSSSVSRLSKKIVT